MSNNKRYEAKIGYYNVFEGNFIETKQYDGKIYIWDNFLKKFCDNNGIELSDVFQIPPQRSICVDAIISDEISNAIESLNEEYDHYEIQLKDTLTNL